MSGITNAVPLVGAVGGTALVDPKAADPGIAVLAFTGMALGMYVGIAVLLLAAGLALRFTARQMKRRQPPG